MHGSGRRRGAAGYPRGRGKILDGRANEEQGDAKYKTKYRGENCPAYEASLRQRGDVTVWFDEGAIGAWTVLPCGHPGGQQRDADLAILTVLTLLIHLRGLDVETPDHTTLSRRSATVVVPPPVPVQAGPIHLIIDSTGLKMVGDGEWHVLKHTSANKRRCWRKLHLGWMPRASSWPRS